MIRTRIITAFVVTAFFFSCNSNAGQSQAGQSPAAQSGKGYTITGKVKNPQPGFVTLLELLPDGFQPVDSAKLDKNNAFSISGKVKEPGFYLLNFFDKQKILVILENASITVEADGNSPAGAYAVKGTRENEDLQKLTKTQSELQVHASELGAKFQAANLKKDEKAKADIQEKYLKLQAEATQKLKVEMRRINPSLATWYGTNMLNPEEEYPFLDSLSKQLQQKLPNSKYTKELVAKLAQYKNMVAVGQPAPDITLNNPDGKPVSLSSLRGKYVLIDFWASWCGPCRQENPNVVKMYEKYKTKNFEIFGVSLDQNKEKWVSAIKADGLSWVHVSDLKYWQSAAAEAYGVRGIPATYLLDPKGVVIAKNLRGQALEAKLAEVLPGL